MHLIEHIEHLFALHGSTPYDDDRREAVSQLEHALQCAQLAEWAQADAPLIVAALLHDIGHFVDDPDEFAHVDDTHEDRAVPLLARAFDERVTQPVRLHVMAKRYLVRVDPGYVDALSPASVHSLGLQGGPMSAEEAERFAALPYAHAAVRLRRWDDLAKVPGRQTPSLGYYLSFAEQLCQPQPVLLAKSFRQAIAV